MRTIIITQKDWPVAGSFRISRSTLTHIATLHVEIEEDGAIGRGECRPYARYSETCESVHSQISAVLPALENNLARTELQTLLPAGAARNAVDCALWDLEAKLSGNSVSDLLGLPKPMPRITAYTLSVDTAERMALAARKAKDYPLLKIKIGSENGLDCAQAVLNARPDARLIIDANEALTTQQTAALLKTLKPSNIAMIEQPLPCSDDNSLATQNLEQSQHGHIICADESLHTSQDLDALWAAGYRAVNVKLDKCGGLTEGLALMQAAKAQGFKIMAGCMVGSSLAMAPMMMLEMFADVIDLDGPLLLSKDIENGLTYKGPKIYPPSNALWG